jgi:hypothetical protein
MGRSFGTSGAGEHLGLLRLELLGREHTLVAQLPELEELVGGAAGVAT